jgi:hypothetical protein
MLRGPCGHVGCGICPGGIAQAGRVVCHSGLDCFADNRWRRCCCAYFGAAENGKELVHQWLIGGNVGVWRKSKEHSLKSVAIMPGSTILTWMPKGSSF